MKKILEKIVSITLGFIALLFVILMLVIMFKPEYAENLNNPFVHVLLIIFSAILGILTFINIYSAFMDNEKINNVLLFKAKSSATKATISVVNKTAKKATKQVEGAKLKKVTLFVDENNDLKIRLDLKIEGEDVEDIVNTVRATISTTFSQVLGLDFATIDFKLIKVKNEYKPDKALVEEKAAMFKAEIDAEKEKEKAKLALLEKEATVSESEKEEITAADDEVDEASKKDNENEVLAADLTEETPVEEIKEEEEV